MKRLRRFTGLVAVLEGNDIDTDQIIPARFFAAAGKNGFGKYLFHDWRFLPDGLQNPEFLLNQIEYRRANILLTGENFGCGSSREQAVWAVRQWGFRAVIAGSFADTFLANANNNGVLAVVLPPAQLTMLFAQARAKAGRFRLTIDLVNQRLLLPKGRGEIEFAMDTFTKSKLLNGWSNLDYVLQRLAAIHNYEKFRARRLGW